MMGADVEDSKNAARIRQSDPEAHPWHLVSRASVSSWLHEGQELTNKRPRNVCVEKFHDVLDRKMSLAAARQKDIGAKADKFRTTRDAMLKQFDCSSNFSEADPTADAKGYIRYLYRTAGDTCEWKINEKEYHVRTILFDKDCLDNDLKRLEKDVSQTSYEWRWIHLPGNNMEWVEHTMLRVVENLARKHNKPAVVTEDAVKQLAEHVLHPRRWTARQVDRSPDMLHARSMDPLAQHFTVASKKSAKEFSTLNQRSFVLFLPFLSWEQSSVVAYRNIVYKEARNIARSMPSLSDGQVIVPSERAARRTASVPCCEREALLRNYLFAEKPLHLRRTLDQSYYSSLSDTQVRDEDQVAERHALKQKHWKLRERIDPCLLMVDQLWLWALERDTIISCFPRSWNHEDSHGYNTTDLFSQLRDYIERKCNDDKAQPGRVWIARLITETCATYIQRLSETSKCHQFMRFFDESLKQVKDEKSRIHRNISSALRDDKVESDESFLNIANEFKVLGEVMDITDEISMILNVIDTQKQILTKFIADFRRKRNEFRPRAAQPTEPGIDPGKGGKEWELFSKLQIEREHWEAILRTANETRDEIKDLVELKQQHATIKLATDTSQQSKSVMLFTLVTILFLPMSTLASIFGVNAADFGQGEVALGRIFAYIFGTSGFVIVVTLWLAFNQTARNCIVLSFEIFFASLMVFIPENIFESTEQRLSNTVQTLRSKRRNKAASQKDSDQFSKVSVDVDYDEMADHSDVDENDTSSSIS